MKAKVLVKVEREAALEAIHTLDALGAALLEHEQRWPKKLKSRYQDARRELINAIGFWASCNGIAELPVQD